MRKIKFMGAMAVVLFGAVDASFAVEKIDTKIDTTANHNNGRPAWEAFSGVAQRVTMASQQGDERATNEMRTEVNDKCRAFLEVWRDNDYSEDVISVGEFIEIVTHPVLNSMDTRNFEKIVLNLIIDNNCFDMLHHCLGSQNFKSFLRNNFAHCVVKRYRSLLRDHTHEKMQNIIKEMENESKEKSEKQEKVDRRMENIYDDQIIETLFLTENFCGKTIYLELRGRINPDILDHPYPPDVVWGDPFGSFNISLNPDNIQNPTSLFLPAQLHYIFKGDFYSGLKHHCGQFQQDVVNNNEVEKKWQNADLGQMLGNLERMRTLDLTMCGPVAHKVRNKILGLGYDFNGDIRLGNWSRFQQQETNLGVRHLFLSDIYLQNAHTAQAYYLLTGNLPENDSDINYAVNVNDQQETVNRDAQILERLRNMSAQGVRISDSSALRLFTDPRMRTIANCIVRHYLEGREPVVSESFLRRLESSGLVNEGLRSSKGVLYGVGWEIVRSEGEPFISDDELRQLYMKVRKRSRDAFEELRRQRAGGQGQGHANQ
jgi:hypothetical protein